MLNISDDIEQKIQPYVLRSQLAFYLSGVHLGVGVMALLLRLLVGQVPTLSGMMTPLSILVGMQTFAAVLFYKISTHFTKKMTGIIESEMKNGK